MSLSQIELIWVRVRVEWECFWVNLREENKVSESKMAEVKMDTIIKLSQNQRVKVFFSANAGEGSETNDFCCGNGGNQSWQMWVSFRGNTKMAESRMAELKMAEFKMAAIFKLSENE